MSGSEQPTLEQLREQIDALDIEIQSLLNQRASLAKTVAEIKRAEAGDAPVVYYRPEREAQLLRKIQSRNRGPLSDQQIAHLFREIMSACLALEQPLSVAYLGPEGTFTHAAALKYFGRFARYQPCIAVNEIFRAVESGTAQYGLVPAENSTEGAVNQTLDCFTQTPLRICGEIVMRIHHHLLVAPDTNPEQIERIYSHPQGLAQCRQWLNQNWPTATPVQVASTAEAAQMVKDDLKAAAIAGDMAAVRYKLKSLARCIEDVSGNRTRFLSVSCEKVPPSGRDKTSLLVYVQNKPGALHQVLALFRKANVNLTRIESRPTLEEKHWSYMFFIDFEGHAGEKTEAKLLGQIEKSAMRVKCLGSYPQAVFDDG